MNSRIAKVEREKRRQEKKAVNMGGLTFFVALALVDTLSPSRKKLCLADLGTLMFATASGLIAYNRIAKRPIPEEVASQLLSRSTNTNSFFSRGNVKASIADGVEKNESKSELSKDSSRPAFT